MENQKTTDESTLFERLQFEMLLSDLSSSFVNMPVDTIDKAIESALGQIATFLGFDRVTFFQRLENGRFKATHSSSVSHVPQVRPYIVDELYPRLLGYLMKHPWPTILSRDDEIPDEIAEDIAKLTEPGIKTRVIVPLIVSGKSLGGLTGGTRREKHEISEKMVQRLRLVAEIFANAMSRKTAENSLLQALNEIRQLKDQLEAECTYLREAIKLEHDFSNVIGRSEVLQQVLQKVEQVAPTDTTVLILGETGTGKDLIAQAIHDVSRRKNKPFIKVDCASLPANLIENELFGHEKGAFTNAHDRKIGRFELANGGTVFLDEIGELPLQLQSKLLRVIQESTFERLGSARVVTVDIRIIAATNRDLKEEVKNGSFRQDLWYRLNVFPILMPALRDRKEDIPMLVEWFVQQSGKKLRKKIEKIPNFALQSLQNYSWPGNIRELQNVIERAVINTEGPTLQLETFQQEITPPQKQDYYPAPLAEIEKQHLINTLEHTRWKIQGPGGAAEILELSPSTLRDRLRKHGIKRPGSV